MSSPSNESILYQHSGRIPLASRISYRVRQQMFRRFMDTMQPVSHLTVLDVGVTSDTQYAESNYFEQWYPYKSQITCVGTEDGQHLERDYPGVHFQQVTGNNPLPWADGTFDIAFSNAVLEHVGNSTAQAFFVAEMFRVAKRVFITTPNRWFPVEPHSGLPLLHYFPKSLYRSLLGHTPWAFWADEQNLNLLTMREFRKCFPSSESVVFERIGVGAGSLRSNLIAFSREKR